MEQLENTIEKSENYLGNIYFNGIEIGFSNSDAHIDLVLNSKKVAKLNMSFGTLKSLSEITTQLVEDIESRTNPILSIGEFRELINESLAKNEIEAKDD